MSVNIESLLEDVKHEKPLSFDAIYHLYLPLIESLSTSYRRRFSLSESETDDLRQEAAIALYNAAKAYSPEKNVTFGAYAKVCLQNRIISYIRFFHKVGIPESFDDIEALPHEIDAATPEQLILSKESLANLNKRIEGTLTVFEKKVFDLYVESMPYEDMAVALGKPKKSIDNAVCRIKAKLRKLL